MAQTYRATGTGNVTNADVTVPSDGEIFLVDIGEGGRQVNIIKNGQLYTLSYQPPALTGGAGDERDWQGKTIGAWQNETTNKALQQMGIDPNNAESINGADWNNYLQHQIQTGAIKGHYVNNAASGGQSMWVPDAQTMTDPNQFTSQFAGSQLFTPQGTVYSVNPNPTGPQPGHPETYGTPPAGNNQVGMASVGGPTAGQSGQSQYQYQILNPTLMQQYKPEQYTRLPSGAVVLKPGVQPIPGTTKQYVANPQDQATTGQPGGGTQAGGGQIPFIPGLSAAQQQSIQQLSGKPLDQWTATDHTNWNYATNNAPPPSGGTGAGTGSYDSSGYTGGMGGGAGTPFDYTQWGITKEQWDALGPGGQAFMQSVAQTVQGQYDSGLSNVSVNSDLLNKAMEAAKTDPDIVAKYGDALKLAQNDITNTLSFMNADYGMQQRQQQQAMVQARKDLAEQQASAGTAFSGFRQQARGKLEQTGADIVESSRRELQKKLQTMGSGVEGAYGSTGLAGNFTPIAAGGEHYTPIGGIVGTIPQQQKADIFNKGQQIFSSEQSPLG